MKTIVLIAVRMKSSRLPKKAIVDIEGKSLIEHLIDRLKSCRVPDKIVLCTSTHPDDEILADIAKRKGIGCFRGSEEDVLERFIQAAKNENADVIVRVTGDNPLTDPVYLDKAVIHHLKTDAEYTFIEGLPRGTECEVMSTKALEKCRKMALNPELSEYMTLYFKASNLFKTEKIVAEPNVKRPKYRLTVDTPEDLKLIREIFKKLYTGDSSFPLSDVVKLLDENPSLVNINAHLRPKKVKMEFVDKKMKIVEMNNHAQS
ncbi:MAG: acylneuraminate cytidylyltransferase [Hadesarchaea archaeon]|nr:MAG: acylneuraminate cytidylyltransferase [Hadesarchaea archaeon]